MDEIYLGVYIWSGRVILEEDGMEGFKIFWGRCLEENGVQAFGSFWGRYLEEDGVEDFVSLNVKLKVFSIFKSFKRDFGIHISFKIYFPLNSLGMMDLGIHICFDFTFWVVDLWGLLNNFSLFPFTFWLDGI